MGQVKPSRGSPNPNLFYVKFRRIVLFAIILLVSCAPVSYQDANEILNRSKSCCTSIAQFTFEQLPEDEVVSFNLDETSDAFVFETGKSYFRLFQLPAKAVPYSIKIRSFVIGQSIADSYVFYPQIALLDDDFVIVSQSSPNDFTFTETKLFGETWDIPLKIEGYVPIKSSDIKYVLIFTTNQLMSGAVEHETRQILPIIVPGIVSAVPVGKKTFLIRHYPFGHLKIETAPY
jgi:hypothetical protein